jgi:hypothetical protein
MRPDPLEYYRCVPEHVEVASRPPAQPVHVDDAQVMREAEGAGHAGHSTVVGHHVKVRGGQIQEACEMPELLGHDGCRPDEPPQGHLVDHDDDFGSSERRRAG